MILELFEGILYLLVFGDVAGYDDVAAQFLGEFGNTFFEALADVGEGQLCALLLAGTSNAVCDRSIRQHARNQDALTVQETHFMILFSCMRLAAYACAWNARSEEHKSELQSLMRITY